MFWVLCIMRSAFSSLSLYSRVWSPTSAAQSACIILPHNDEKWLKCENGDGVKRRARAGAGGRYAQRNAWLCLMCECSIGEARKMMIFSLLPSCGMRIRYKRGNHVFAPFLMARNAKVKRADDIEHHHNFASLLQQPPPLLHKR